jgi:hypothetical protein
MSAPKKHILLNGYVVPKPYSRNASPQQDRVPFNNQINHGSQLLSQYQNALTQYDKMRSHFVNPIMEETGIYVEIKSMVGVNLPLNSLDNTSFTLQNFKVVNNQEVISIFILDSKRDTFSKKINEYLDISKNKSGKPKNHSLIDSISEIRLADLRSFWTDDQSLFPTTDKPIWWELWLKVDNRNYAAADFIARQLAERIEARIRNTSLTFLVVSKQDVFWYKESIANHNSTQS